MSEVIKCPKCGEVFKIDEDSYASIVAQVRNDEFEKEVRRRIGQAEQNAALKHELESAGKIAELNSQIALLKKEIENAASDREKALMVIKSQAELLKKDVQNAIKDKESAVNAIRLEMSAKINEYENTIKLNDAKGRMEKEQIESKYKELIKQEEEKVSYFRDLKTKMSTKLLGETLEQHCQIAFNSIRSSAYPYATFAKDNEVSSQSGSKGDFIFRDYDGPEKENEIVSIMFEMKNEMDTTATKHKNSDFFKELDKDRREKKCEYAVLVSMLEADSELYNAGIVDVSYEYEKMFVVRPQCFLAIIGLLRGANRNALAYKQELAVVRKRDVDVTNFENKLLDFQEKFGSNYKKASDNFQKAIDEIDKTISNLMKVKASLTSSEYHLRLANDKAQDLSIKKLTHASPTMKKKFDDTKTFT